jgi:hypothetical protein
MPSSRAEPDISPRAVPGLDSRRNADTPAGYATFRLLCAALASRRDAEGRRRAEAEMAQPNTAARLVQLAARERMQPRLHEAIADSAAMPKAYRAVLALQHEANRRRNATIRSVLLELGAVAAADGFDVTALKGAAWVAEEPEACAWRTMIDVDVLVDPRFFARCPALLQRLGYRPASKARRFDDNFHLAPYARAGLPFTLEVHRHLGWRHALLPPEIVRENAQRIAPGLLLPDPWYRAFHAMIHWQVQDGGRGRATIPVKDIVEIGRFLERADVDWAALAAHARAVKAEAECEAAVALATTLLGVEAPRELAITPRGSRHVARAVRRKASPLRTCIAAEMWRAGTLWRCEKIRYRAALRGSHVVLAELAVWARRVVQAPLLAVRVFVIGVRTAYRLLGLR